MSQRPREPDAALEAIELIRLRGQVQGVGFRPTVSRVATKLGLRGWVKNDAEGLLIALACAAAQSDHFVDQLLAELPPLARVDELLRTRVPAADADALPERGFSILGSATSAAGRPLATSIVPDAALCEACRAELHDPTARRFRYAFGSCTHCGPRFSIALGLPWDRARTTLKNFELCDACRAEHADPRDRRFHAEPIACPRCGPQLTLWRSDGTRAQASDAITEAASLLARGDILALKGLGGFQLLVDATNDAAVRRLRERKQRPHKPFALMARDLQQVLAYAHVSELEESALRHPASPIVLLSALTTARARPLATALGSSPPMAANKLGFMLAATPLHELVLSPLAHPVVCTSGNRSEAPQVIDDADALAQLRGIADWILGHDRPIHQRVDDSVVRVVGGRMRVLRRARGFAPAPLPLPDGFAEIAAAQAVFAAGGDLKAAVCLSRRADLVLSQHLGDLADAATHAEYARSAAHVSELFEHRPTRVAIDNHPDSRAAALARQLDLPCERVAHHHAHFAACLGENAVALSAPDCLGLVLDGLGAGEVPGQLWGAEVLVGGYAEVTRAGTLQPAALLGGDKAAREPWRCLYAQLAPVLGRAELAHFTHVPSLARLGDKPVALLDRMLATGIGAPLASSCGRLFDAVAALLDLCFDAQTYEGQAAQALELSVTDAAIERARAERSRAQHYPCHVHGVQPLTLDTRELWRALLADVARGEEVSMIAARFHVALAAGFAELCARVWAEREHGCRPVARTVALSGGCMQNAWLHTLLSSELESLGFRVLSHAAIPANDGGIALGQALVSLARADRALER